jgi:hypothetical protein
MNENDGKNATRAASSPADAGCGVADDGDDVDDRGRG